MKLILNNPYRIIGLLAGATAREKDRQVKRLKQYIEAEQDPGENYSFPILGKLSGTIADVEYADSMLNLDSDKIAASLFWFYKGNTVTDEPAFEALKDQDIETAFQIWDKLITDTKEDGKKFWKPVTQKNYSAFHNCAVLNLVRPNGNLSYSIAGEIFFLESDLVQNFVSNVADSTYKPSKKDLQLSFLKQLFGDIEYSNKISVNQFIEIVSKLHFSAKQDFLNSFIQKPIDQIAQLIEECKTKRKADKANAVSNGNILYQKSSDNIKQLKSILGASDIKFSSVSDKVADEILQCGIDYFKHYRESDSNTTQIATMDLFQKAKSLAIGSIVSQRIQDNTEGLQEWINDKPERDKQKRIANDLQVIASKLERFQKLTHTVSNAKDLVDGCKPQLISIKNILGAMDDFYLKISSAVANNALRMLISVINGQQYSIALHITLRDTLISALEVSYSIGTLDMLPEQRNYYNQNHSTLEKIASQLSVSRSSNGKGCAPWLSIAFVIFILIMLLRSCK